jgi:hypothetical protein
LEVEAQPIITILPHSQPLGELVYPVLNLMPLMDVGVEVQEVQAQRLVEGMEANTAEVVEEGIVITHTA